MMEADFNFHNKLVFGSRMINAARGNALVPPEQYSKKHCTVDDGSFDKVLQGDFDIPQWQHLASSIISAYTAN